MQKETRACMPPCTSKAENMKANSWGYPQSALRLTVPSAEGALWWGSHAKPLPRRDRHSWAAGTRSPAQAGHGGSVSRRDHNQAYRRRAQLTGATYMKEQPTRTPATLRERGSGGEALLLEKRPLPRDLSPQKLFGREREGGASLREAASLASPSPPLPLFFLCLDVAFECRVGIMEVSCEIKERL